MPTWRAMAAAVRPLSPVIITVDRSMWCSAARAGTESGLMVSATARTPAVGRRPRLRMSYLRPRTGRQSLRPVVSRPAAG